MWKMDIAHCYCEQIDVITLNYEAQHIHLNLNGSNFGPMVHVNVKSPVGPHKFSGTFSVNQNLFKFREGYEFFQEIVT